MRQQFLQGLDILVIHVLFAPPAEPALGLLRHGQLTGIVRPVISSFASSVVSSFAIFRHIFTFIKTLILQPLKHQVAKLFFPLCLRGKSFHLKRYIVCGRMRSLYRPRVIRLNLAVRPGFTACSAFSSGSAALSAAEKLEVLDDNPVPASL